MTKASALSVALAALCGCATARGGSEGSSLRGRGEEAPVRALGEDASVRALGEDTSLLALREGAYVSALREEAHAVSRAQRLFGWLEGTRGERALSGEGWASHPRLFELAAREALARAEARRGLPARERLALRFLRRSLAAGAIARATAPFDDALSAAELAASAPVPGFDNPIPYRNLSTLLAAEPDGEKRARLSSAQTALLDTQLNPLLEAREAAAQTAARGAGFADYVAYAEELREVALPALLAEGVGYLRATDEPYLRTLDRVAREELGVPRAALRLSDLPRLWKAPRLLGHFPVEGALPALRAFLDGIGLDLRTSAGTEVLIDREPRPLKRPRAFVSAVDAPRDIRLSVKPTGGLDDYWTLFHEAGHAVHFASATAEPRELVELGHSAPGEAFGELFRAAFADRGWLARYRTLLIAQGRPAPTAVELAAVLRRTALLEMMYLRRYAFAKVAYEVRLHGRPLEEIATTLALLPEAGRARAAGSLRGLYRELFGLAYGVALGEDDAARFRADVDDGMAAADYARCFALAAMLDEGLRRRFGDWTANSAVGPFLRSELFAPGRSLSVEEVAARLGFAPRLDFSLAVERALRLLREADALEAGGA